MGQITDLSLIRNCSPLFEHKIVIYGTGLFGKKFYIELQHANIKVECFAETFPKKEIFLNKKVLSAEDLKKFCELQDVMIIIASDFYSEIYETLQIIKGNWKGIVTAFAVRQSIYYHIHESYFSTSFQKNYLRSLNMWRQLKITHVEHKRKYEYYSVLKSILEDDGTDILVYNPGKVGSLSVYESLKKNGVACQHLHIINNMAMHDNVDYQKMIKQLKNLKIKIITGIREPISRGISAYMFRLAKDMMMLEGIEEADLVKDCEKYLMKEGCIEKIDPTYTDSKIKMDEKIIGNEFLWFNKEIKEVFDIDIYKYPFDKEKGYGIIKQDNVEIFIYKLESLNKVEQEMGKFVGVDNFKLIKCNTADSTMSKYLYNQIKDSIQIPTKCFQFYYYENSYLEHFYTKKEIEQYKNKWNEYT